jgi:Domain of unknown function (DUF4386)
MRSQQRSGGLASLYMALAYLIGMVFFLVVLRTPSITEPADRVALLVAQQNVILATNLLMYVFFGIVLVVLALALHERLKVGAPAVMGAATAIALIWAASLILSGMVANASVDPVVGLYARDPAQAALVWQAVESVTNGLSDANGEILGGLWTLLIAVAAQRAGQLPRFLNLLGAVVGAVGIVSIVPGLAALTGVFGVGQLIWFAWL